MGAVEHRAISLERGIEPAGPAEFQELGDGRVVPSSGESGAARLQQPLPVASILRGQPAGVGVDGGRLGALGADPMARARGTDGIHPGTAEPDAGHQDDDEQGAPALPLEPRNAARLSLPERRPRPWDAAASLSCGSRHDGSSIVTFEAREARRYHWSGGGSLLQRSGPCPRFPGGARLAQCRPTTSHRRSSWAAGDRRLLDLLLNQLHPYLSAVAEDRAEIRR